MHLIIFTSFMFMKSQLPAVANTGTSVCFLVKMIQIPHVGESSVAQSVKVDFLVDSAS